LEEEMLRFLIQNDQYNTIRPLIMSELYKQWLKHFFFSWCIRALPVPPDPTPHPSKPLRQWAKVADPALAS
jgi:hypothetical protein